MNFSHFECVFFYLEFILLWYKKLKSSKYMNCQVLTLSTFQKNMGTQNLYALNKEKASKYSNIEEFYEN